MPNKTLQIAEYKEFIQSVKSKIHSSQFKAHIKVNEAMLKLYWNIGQMIVEKQKSVSWGDGFIADISKDLQKWYVHYSISSQAVDFFKDTENKRITHKSSLPSIEAELKSIE